MINTDKSSIYISIFKRKGGEGFSTKIINEGNIENYSGLLSILEVDEKPLIIYFLNPLNYFLFTKIRVIICKDGQSVFLNIKDIIEVSLALRAEMSDGILDKQKFSRLKIKTKNGDCFLCDFEQGQPYEGMYQVLHFIATNNICKNS